MSVDIVEIAFDNMTVHQQFEKLASEVMRDEGYPNINSPFPLPCPPPIQPISGPHP